MREKPGSDGCYAVGVAAREPMKGRVLGGSLKVLSRLVCAVAAVAVLAGCEHLPLYNKEKDQLAQDARKGFTDAKVTEALDVQEENLAKLLTAEVAALNESAALRLDIALLRMSDDKEVPDGSTSLAAWYARAGSQIKELGLLDDTLVLAMLDHRIDVAQANIQIETVKARLGSGSDGARALAALPGCSEVKDADPGRLSWKYAETVENAFDRQVRQDEYKAYVKACQQSLVTPPKGTGGRVNAAFSELLSAEAALRARRGKAAALAEKVKQKAAELKTKQEEATKNQTKLADARQELDRVVAGAKETAEDLLAAFTELNELAGGEGADLIAKKNIETINTVLVAIGSGQANSAGMADSRLASAVSWIRTNVPSLAEDMAALADRGQAPPVSNLILELQHQIIEQNYARALIALSEKRIELLRARYRTLVDAAAAWRGFRLALCNFAVLSANRPHPGEKCDKFAVELAKGARPDTSEAHCVLDGVEIANCALTLIWRKALDDTPSGRKKREIFGALYQYAEAFEAERASREAQFHLADLDHRETLAAQRSGIEAWNNLVAVPMGQLAAYHASGIKPEAVADFIATLLGLSAIGVGAAQ